MSYPEVRGCSRNSPIQCVKPALSTIWRLCVDPAGGVKIGDMWEMSFYVLDME